MQRCVFWAVIPLALLGFIFGIVLVGTSLHMRGAHQILALLLLPVTAASGYVHFKQNPVLSFNFSQSPRKTFVLQAKKPLSYKHLGLIYKGLITTLFIFALATLLTGFGDLTTLTLCIVQQLVTVTGFVAMGMAIMATWMIAIGVYALKTWTLSRFVDSRNSLTISSPMRGSMPVPNILSDLTSYTSRSSTPLPRIFYDPKYASEKIPVEEDEKPQFFEMVNGPYAGSNVSVSPIEDPHSRGPSYDGGLKYSGSISEILNLNGQSFYGSIASMENAHLKEGSTGPGDTVETQTQTRGLKVKVGGVDTNYM